jgi:hypothetical protein
MCVQISHGMSCPDQQEKGREKNKLLGKVRLVRDDHTKVLFKLRKQ